MLLFFRLQSDLTGRGKSGTACIARAYLAFSRKGEKTMGLRLQTAWARRRRKRRRAGWHTCWLPALLLVLLALPAVFLASLRPKLSEYAVNYVQYQATSVMEQAVAQCAAEMGSMGELQTDETGSVTSLTTDAAALNLLRTKVVQQVYDDIGALETARASVAVGTLLDPQYLAGIGPELSFGVTALGCVTAQVDSDFSAAGINQTLHTVSIRVTADFSIQLLGGVQTVTVSAEYPLEETVIVGDVPMIASNS